jgi:2-deoxy-D-gluconate 3-dehydrogenase
MFKDLFSLQGRVALVTGGSRGIGKMIAAGFLAQGAAKVYITARKAGPCEATAKELTAAYDGECIALPIDISTVAGCDQLAAEFIKRESKLDILVNNAGAAWGADFDEFPESGWDKVMDLNVKSMFFLTKALAKPLRAAATRQRPAKVINIASIDGIFINPMETYSYGASKAAVIHLTRRLATKLIKENIVVTAIAPGAFASDMNKAARDHADEVAKRVPSGRIGDEKDMAGLAIFLASRAGDYVVGNAIAIDGGVVYASAGLEIAGEVTERAFSCSPCDPARAFREPLSAGLRRRERSRSPLRSELQQPCCISARQLRQRRLIHAIDTGNMTDRIVFGHVIRIVGPHQDTIGAEHVEQIRQLVIAEHDSVEINLTQVGRRWQGQIAVRILPGTPRMIDAPGVGRQVAATMHSHELEVRKSCQRSTEDQVVQRQRRLQRIAEHVVEVEVRQPLPLRKAVGVKHDECAKLFGSGEEWPVSRIRQFLAVDIGQDLYTLQLQVRHDIVEFAHGQLRLLQRHASKAEKPVRLARAEFRDTVVGDAMRLSCDLGSEMIVALAGRRCDDLDIDAHPVEIAQAPVDGGHHLVDVFLLTGIDRLGRIVGEVTQRDAASIDMRLRDPGGFRHKDVRMDIDGRR